MTASRLSTRTPTPSRAFATVRRRLAAAALLLVAGAAAAQPVRYHLEALDPGAGELLTPRGIDALGRVVGNTTAQAVVFDTPTTLRVLPSLGGLSVAYAGNASGLVVGGSCPLRQRALHAVSWQDGAVSDLGALPRLDGGDPSSTAYAVNSRGDIAGTSAITQRLTHGFVVHAGVMTDIGTLPGGQATFASGINDRGHVVGVAGAANGASHAFIWRRGHMTDLTPADGSADFTNATAINNHDTVVGFGHLTATPLQMLSALMWRGGRQIVLGSLGTGVGYETVALAINDAGVVVGRTQTATGSVAFIVPPGGVMTDLNTLMDDASRQADWDLGTATGIDAGNEITGLGSIGGRTVAFIARPVR
jgi:probable HAF family extracellular repeat protein